jgi:hypothetical protein
MKGSRAVALVTLLLLFLVALSGCSTAPGEGAGGDITVRVVATEDFGREVMLDETLEVPAGTSAMTALERVAEVETAYGGGFVRAIDGRRSGGKKDWFVYANGMMTNVGALDYTLHDGDIERWDLRDWGFRMFIPAIAGYFPEPLVHGYDGRVRPTVVVYADGLREQAEALKAVMTQLGVEDVSIENGSSLAEDEKKASNLVLLGTMDFGLVSELNERWDRLGFFAHFKDGALVVHNSKGEVEAEYGAGSGVVQATQSPWNPKGVGACENVVWMVSGTDEAGVESALDALMNRHDQFEHAYAAVAVDGEIVRVPQ